MGPGGARALLALRWARLGGRGTRPLRTLRARALALGSGVPAPGVRERQRCPGAGRGRRIAQNTWFCAAAEPLFAPPQNRIFCAIRLSLVGGEGHAGRAPVASCAVGTRRFAAALAHCIGNRGCAPVPPRGTPPVPPVRRGAALAGSAPPHALRRTCVRQRRGVVAARRRCATAAGSGSAAAIADRDVFHAYLTPTAFSTSDILTHVCAAYLQMYVLLAQPSKTAQNVAFAQFLREQ